MGYPKQQASLLSYNAQLSTLVSEEGSLVVSVVVTNKQLLAFPGITKKELSPNKEKKRQKTIYKNGVEYIQGIYKGVRQTIATLIFEIPSHKLKESHFHKVHNSALISNASASKGRAPVCPTMQNPQVGRQCPPVTFCKKCAHTCSLAHCYSPFGLQWDSKEHHKGGGLSKAFCKIEKLCNFTMGHISCFSSNISLFGFAGPFF